MVWVSKDLEILNRVILAKEAWELLCRHCSLVFKMLKGPYSLYGHFVQAKTHVMSSWSWTSLCFAKDVLKQDEVWCIGNGGKKNIWSDRCFMKFGLLESFRVDDLNLVSDLINPVMKCWKVDIISSLFTPWIRNEILSKPISNKTSGKLMSNLAISYCMKLKRV